MITASEFDAWLDSPSTHGVSMSERICFLVAANGGWEVSGWGCLSWHKHQMGLEQGDAIALIHLHGYFCGMEAAGFDAREHFLPRFKEYVARFKEEEKPTAPVDA